MFDIFVLILAGSLLIGFGATFFWVLRSLLDHGTHQPLSGFDILLLVGCALGGFICIFLILTYTGYPHADDGIQQSGPALPKPAGAHPSQTVSQSSHSPMPVAKQQAASGPPGGAPAAPLTPVAQGPGALPGDPAQAQPQPPAPQLVPFQQVEPAQFENKEPDDLRYPYFHSVARGIPEGAGGKGWAIVGSSRRGLSHEHEGKYREDAMAFAIVDGWHLVAVGDGGGAYSLARVGANVAVERALAAMKACVQNNTTNVSFFHRGKAKPQLLPGDLARQAVLAGFRAAYGAVRDEAKALGEEEKQLRTTLLLLAHRQEKSGTHVVAGGQIGDGILVGRDAQGALTWFGTPDTGPSGNEVLFLQDVNPDEWHARRVVVDESMAGAGCHFLVMTDGVADDFLPIDQNLIRLEKPLFESVLAGKSPSEAALALTELLGYQRAASFDDRTLVCIYESGSAQ